jgi:hypothetical protein
MTPAIGRRPGGREREGERMIMVNHEGITNFY